MTIELPKFNLDKSTAAFANEDEVQAQIDKESVGNRFEQGNYELKILEARFNRVCELEPDWMSLCVTLGTGIEGDEREIRFWPLIPLTQKIKYHKSGSPKSTMKVWEKTVSFLNGLGIPSRQDDLDKFQTKYLAGDGCTKEITYQAYDEEVGGLVEAQGVSFHKLIGKSIEVDLGYAGYNIRRVEDTETFGVYNKNKLVVKKVEDDRGKTKEVELIGDSYDDCLGLMLEHDMDPSEQGFKLCKLSPIKIYAGKVASVTNIDLDAI